MAERLKGALRPLLRRLAGSIPARAPTTDGEGVTQMGNEVWRGEVVTQHAAGLTEREVTVRSPKGSISAPPPVGATVAVVGLADYYALEKAERERDQAREENERLVDEADEAREDVWRLREVSGYVPCPRCRATGWVEIMVGGDPDQCMLRPSDPAPPDEAECRERLGERLLETTVKHHLGYARVLVQCDRADTWYEGRAGTGDEALLNALRAAALDAEAEGEDA